uniref:Uncharacterized protein n=1 Tax=Setaria viridis TaxID=4556 RepID=A0A4U6UZL1_SETVI|nr:hypothetical protein SEVIR_4G160202v2 [Setaria viridis]
MTLETRLWIWLPMTCMFFGTSPSRALSRVAQSTLSDVNHKSVPIKERALKA